MGAESEIAKWYRGKDIFITGATGFMGKVLIEKLLRSCPDVGTIYILVRDKRDLSFNDRVEDMLRSCLFDKLRASGVNLSEKIVAISGDVGLSGLGISDHDRRLLQDTVSVVFHVAATVKFDEPLRLAVAMNLEGTQAMLKLCKEMKNLSAVVHVSTAYTNCDLSDSIIKERVYPPPGDPDRVLQYVGGLEDDALDFITPRLINKHPNTYTFTKALAEDVVSRHSVELPIVIVRPSIVAASWKEPQPGWVDNFNGPTAIIVGTAKGMLKTIYGHTNITVDLIPVDVCINLFIAAAWEIGTREKARLVPEILVYNCVSCPFKKLTWNEFINSVYPMSLKYAMSDAFTAPEITMTTSRARHAWNNFIFQNLPAFVADSFIRFSGGKPKFQRIQSKLNQMVTMLEFFTTHEWQFQGDNVTRLKNRLNTIDRRIFDFDMTKMDWNAYAESYFLGIRRNVMKEEDDTIPEARRRIAKLRLASATIKVGFLLAAGFQIFKYYNISLEDVRSVDLRSYFLTFIPKQSSW